MTHGGGVERGTEDACSRREGLVCCQDNGLVVAEEHLVDSSTIYDTQRKKDGRCGQTRPRPFTDLHFL